MQVLFLQREFLNTGQIVKLHNFDLFTIGSIDSTKKIWYHLRCSEWVTLSLPILYVYIGIQQVGRILGESHSVVQRQVF